MIGRDATINKVKAGLPGFGQDGSNSVYQYVRGCDIVAGNVVKADIAKAAFFQ